MVRRWSYINSVNNLSTLVLAKHLAPRRAASEMNVNSVMYLRKHYSSLTLLRRRRWARRKHLFNFIPMVNIMAAWAQNYRFKRNYAKFVMSQNFFKHSFLAFNYVSTMNSIASLHKGMGDIVVSPVVNRLFRGLAPFLDLRSRFFLNLKHYSLSVISVASLSNYKEFFTNVKASAPALYDGLGSFAPWESTALVSRTAHLNSFRLLQRISFNQVLASAISLYKTLVLLTVYRLKF